MTAMSDEGGDAIWPNLMLEVPIYVVLIKNACLFHTYSIHIRYIMTSFV